MEMSEEGTFPTIKKRKKPMKRCQELVFLFVCFGVVVGFFCGVFLHNVKFNCSHLEKETLVHFMACSY